MLLLCVPLKKPVPQCLVPWSSIRMNLLQVLWQQDGLFNLLATSCNQCHSLSVSVSGCLAQFPGIRHCTDTAVLLLHSVDHIVENARCVLTVSQSFKSLDYILRGKEERRPDITWTVLCVTLSDKCTGCSTVPCQSWPQTSVHFWSQQKQLEQQSPPLGSFQTKGNSWASGKEAE